MTPKTQTLEANTKNGKQAYWKSHLETWKASGLSQAQYCQKHQLKTQSFTYWKSKLEKQCTLPPLLPVTVRTDIKQKTSFLHSGIVLSFNDRIKIQLENGFNSDTLSRLIDLLERR